MICQLFYQGVSGISADGYRCSVMPRVKEKWAFKKRPFHSERNGGRIKNEEPDCPFPTEAEALLSIGEKAIMQL